jgi:Tol biopolymer transport system component
VPAPVVAHRRNRERLAWIVAALAVLLAFAGAGVGFLHFRERPPEVQPIRFTLPPPEKTTFGDAMALSPDGTRLALIVKSEGKQSLWIRRLDSITAQPLAGSDGADYPFWSPDGRFIAFFADRKLMKIEASGGPATTLCDAPNGRRGAWNREGVIIFPPLAGGSDTGGVLHRVSAEGGPSTPITALDQSRKEDAHRHPQFLPDGRHFLYYAQSLSKRENDSIYVDSLDSKPGSNNRKSLLKSNWMPAYVPAIGGRGGYLLFIREGTLLAQRFNPDRLELSGEPVPVAERVTDPDPSGFAFYSVSMNGVLAHWTTGSVGTQLVWFDRTGKQLGTVGEAGSYLTGPTFSPDQRRLVIERRNKAAGNSDLWLFDLSRKTASRFTFDPGMSRGGIWSPDGSRIVFNSNREGAFNLYEKAASGIGGEEQILKANSNAFPYDWSRDGRFIVYGELDPKTKGDIWVLPLEGDRKPFPFAQTAFDEGAAALSPDGRWLAYTSDESGKSEVYVRTFTGKPETAARGGKWLVSTNGGLLPIWRRDGRELYYIGDDLKIMAVDVKSGPIFEAGTGLALFQALANNGLDVTADGQRFLLNAQIAGQRSETVNVVLNWQAALKR